MMEHETVGVCKNKGFGKTHTHTQTRTLLGFGNYSGLGGNAWAEHWKP